MKLDKVTENDPMERLAVSIRKSTHGMIADYMALYEKEHGDKIEKSQLVDEILRAFISTDPDYKKVAASKEKASKPAKSAAA